MIRNIVSIIAGYAVFVITSLLLFTFSGIKPHADPTISFILLTALYGVVFSFLSGFITQLIAKTGNLTINYILALILGGFALFSLLKTEGNHYTQLLAVFIFAPSSILGGLFYCRRNK